MSYTPGPWKVENVESVRIVADDDRNNYMPIRDGGASEFVAHLIVTDEMNDETVCAVVAYSDTHLIAAAPDLLEACKKMILALYNDSPDSAKEIYAASVQMEQAVAKAEGKQ